MRMNAVRAAVLTAVNCLWIWGTAEKAKVYKR
jgi:hypothetical protein